MVRALLLVVFALSAVACGSKEEPAAKVEPGAPAGKVVELSGTVTASQPASRTLATGDSVAADDVIDTGSDGRVTIELTHNLAHYELGPNKRQRVSESLAWNEPRHEAPAARVEQDTAAAGRPAERSAADTTVSAVTADSKRRARSQEVTSVDKPPASPVPEKRPSRAASHASSLADIGTIGHGGGETGGGASDKAPPPPPAVQPQQASGGLATRSPKDSAVDPTLEPAVQAAVRAKMKALAACDRDAKAIQVVIRLHADGTVTFDVITGTTSDAARACITDIITKLKLPKADLVVPVVITHPE